jgi:hypothetical protein
MHRLQQGVARMRKFIRPGSIGRQQGKSGKWTAIALVLSLLVGGCSLLPARFHSSPAGQDQALFLQGLDKLSATGSPEAFRRLSTEFPHSPWTARAKSIEKIREQLQKEQRERGQQQKRLEECRGERDRLAGDGRSLEELQKGLDACRIEQERLAGDVRSLEKYTLRLKSLLAESGIVEPAPPVR